MPRIDFENQPGLRYSLGVRVQLKRKRAARPPTGQRPGRPTGAFLLGVEACRSYLLCLHTTLGPTHVWPHNRTIAKALGKSERQVCRYLRALVDDKLLRRQTRKYKKHSRFFTARVLIPLLFRGQPVFGMVWYGDHPPNLKMSADVKRVFDELPSVERRESERRNDAAYLLKKNQLMAALRTAKLAAASGSGGEAPRANRVIRRIMQALQELSK